MASLGGRSAAGDDANTCNVVDLTAIGEFDSVPGTDLLMDTAIV